VNQVSLTIGAGECYGLLGPNGAGKTTTILIITGLLTPDSGSVSMAPDSAPVTSPHARRRIGYVPQEIALYDDLTARENLRFFGRLYQLSRGELKTRVEEVLESVGLTDRADERISTYSGGMKRRINIAVALLHKPSLLVLDEPTVGVDPQSRNLILEHLEQLRDSGIAILYTSHQMDEVERICTRIAVLDEGRILASGTRNELLAELGEYLDHIQLTCQGFSAPVEAQIAALDGVVGVKYVGTTLDVTGHDAAKLLPEILTVLGRHGVDVAGLSVERPDLEAVFLHLTGKALRDV